MKETIVLKTLDDTERLAKRIAKKLRGGEVLALSGPLGSGKTTFTQLLGEELGVRDVKSPTFMVMNVHTTNIPTKDGSGKVLLCHVDAYRLMDNRELDAIGLPDYLGELDVITVVEWAERIRARIPKRSLWLKFSLRKGVHAVNLIDETM